MASTATEETPRDAAHTATPAAPHVADAPLRLLLFAVGATLYGCDIGTVREIVPIRQATRLPGAPEYVRGLINLRGAIVTVIDLAARLSGGRAAPEGSIVLAQNASKVVGLAVDEVRDVQPLSADRFEAAAGDVGRGGIVSGLGHLDDGVVLVLDVQAVVRQVLA